MKAYEHEQYLLGWVLNFTLSSQNDRSNSVYQSRISTLITWQPSGKMLGEKTGGDFRCLTKQKTKTENQSHFTQKQVDRYNIRYTSDLAWFKGCGTPQNPNTLHPEKQTCVCTDVYIGEAKQPLRISLTLQAETRLSSSTSKRKIIFWRTKMYILEPVKTDAWKD